MKNKSGKHGHVCYKINIKKKESSLQHTVFPGGHPSKY